MTQADYQYFQSRAREEDEAARLAKSVEAQISHQGLAEAYRRRCREILGSQAQTAIPSFEAFQAAAAETRRASAPRLRTAFGFAPTAASHKERSLSAAS